MTAVDKLMEAFNRHGKIVIGVDFDDTFFTNVPELQKRCENVRSLLKEAMPFATICLWTVADPRSLDYKVEIMRLYGIPTQHPNSSPVEYPQSRKPYFNLLLDDNAGLRSAMGDLRTFIDIVENLRKNEVL